MDISIFHMHYSLRQSPDQWQLFFKNQSIVENLIEIRTIIWFADQRTSQMIIRLAVLVFVLHTNCVPDDDHKHFHNSYQKYAIHRTRLGGL